MHVVCTKALMIPVGVPWVEVLTPKNSSWWVDFGWRKKSLKKLNPILAGPVLNLTERSDYGGSPNVILWPLQCELGGTMHRNVEAPCPYPCKPRDRLSRHGHGQSLGTLSSPAASNIRRQPADDFKDTKWHQHGTCSSLLSSRLIAWWMWVGTTWETVDGLRWIRMTRSLGQVLIRRLSLL